MSFFSHRRAEALHAAGVKCSKTGNDDQAIENYHKALALDPRRADTLHNLGLIYKYRGAWRASLDFNQRARELQPDDEATLWNLAIAATALRVWGTAREVWRALKIITEPGEGPIEGNRGQTPLRLNADDASGRAVEVIWSQLISPITARLLNIPTGATGFRYADVVLHDGAPVGYRLNAEGQERPVFNVLELFEPSRFATYEVSVEADSAEGLSELERGCAIAGIEMEDWTANLRNLCKACSEGRPHEGHDQELKESNPWDRSRRIGFAAVNLESLNEVLRQWAEKPGHQVAAIRCSLDGASE